MHDHCCITRRNLLSAVAGTGLACGTTGARPADAPEAPPANAAEALKRLAEGNARFVEGKTRHAHAGAEWRKQLVAGQRPFATVLGCSDSRVPVELVFDQGFGDLFVIRVAGNVISTDVVGSIEYAAEHLRTSLIVVMGHQGCGAVTAALAELEKPSKEPRGLKSLLKMIEPGLPRQLPKGTADERVSAAVEANVRWSLRQLATLPEAKPAIEAKRVTLAGAVYELASGTVRFLKA